MLNCLECFICLHTFSADSIFRFALTQTRLPSTKQTRDLTPMIFLILFREAVPFNVPTPLPL